MNKNLFQLNTRTYTRACTHAHTYTYTHAHARTLTNINKLLAKIYEAIIQLAEDVLKNQNIENMMIEK